MRMTFDKINRRAHLYLGMVLVPWFLLYALSGAILNHGDRFKAKPNGKPEFTLRWVRPYHLPPVTDDSDVYALADKVLADTDLTGRYRASFDDDGNLVIRREKLWSLIRITYFPKEGRLRAEDQTFHLDRFLTSAHFRAGYSYPYAIEWLWAILIDVLVLSTLIWIASGVYMWIRLRRFRVSGALCLIAGLAAFLVTVLGM
jgi:hypothetical protein